MVLKLKAGTPGSALSAIDKIKLETMDPKYL